MSKKHAAVKLWDKNFTIIILGSLISMLGATVSTFAFSLLVYDRTESTFLFALMSVTGMLPQLFIPIIAGAVLDRRSRRKAIYIIDFIYTGMFLIITLLINANFFNYVVYLGVMFLMGCLAAFYNVAYDSYYPLLISKGNYSKAYSVSSLIYPIASTIMVPIAGWAYDYIGLTNLFAFTTCTFLITAIIETRMDGKEPHLDLSREELAKAPKVSHFRRFAIDLKFGIDYLKKEKGLLTITSYFFCTMMAGAVLSALYLPYLKDTFATREIGVFSFTFAITSTILYSIIMAANTFGRIIGGVVHYKHKFPVAAKFAIALTVYSTITLIDAVKLFLPSYVIIGLEVLSGMLAVTSFNIRTAATQNYIPDTVRGRFNGIFMLITLGGSIIGELVGGALGEIWDIRLIVLGAMILNFLGIIFIMYRGRNHVKQIYNCDV
jgi:MFS family permease